MSIRDGKVACAWDCTNTAFVSVVNVNIVKMKYWNRNRLLTALAAKFYFWHFGSGLGTKKYSHYPISSEGQALEEEICIRWSGTSFS